jgi:hypothetical protein
MPNFVLLLHQNPKMLSNASPEEIQKILAKYGAWREELVRTNKMRAGIKLGNDGGRHMRVAGEKISVTDGPYSESQEVLGGLFMIEAANYDEAVAIARTGPHLIGGNWIEVRSVDVVHP